VKWMMNRNVISTIAAQNSCSNRSILSAMCSSLLGLQLIFPPEAVFPPYRLLSGMCL
jgi:hypothetical protein